MPRKKENNNSSDEKVKITQKLIHYLPCSVSQTREKGWDITRTYEWGEVRSFAIETININDLFILIAITKAFQDYNPFVKEGEVREDKPTLALKLGFWSFAKYYLGSHDEGAIKKSLQRLISWKVIFIQKKGDVNPQEYLVDFKIFEEEGVKKVIFVLNKHFYNACINRGLLLNFDALKAIKSNLTKALFIYLEGTSAKSFYQQTLERVLNMDRTDMKPFTRRAKIKEAFEILKNHLLIQGYQCEKKEQGYLFSYQ